MGTFVLVQCSLTDYYYVLDRKENWNGNVPFNLFFSKFFLKLNIFSAVEETRLERMTQSDCALLKKIMAQQEKDDVIEEIETNNNTGN